MTNTETGKILKWCVERDFDIVDFDIIKIEALKKAMIIDGAKLKNKAFVMRILSIIPNKNKLDLKPFYLKYFV